MKIESLAIRPRLSTAGFLRRGGLSMSPIGVGGDMPEGGPLSSRGENKHGELLDEALHIFDRCRDLVRPKALWAECEVWVVDDEEVWLDEKRFRSRCLAANLQAIDRVVAFVATCGTELEDFAVGGDALTRFWIDLIKELSLDAIVRELKRVAAEKLGSIGVASMNPGSAETDVWPIEQQRELFRLLGDTVSTIGVVLTERLLMIPNKSLSGILFPSDEGWVSCQACSRLGCVARRASYQGARKG